MVHNIAQFQDFWLPGAENFPIFLLYEYLRWHHSHHVEWLDILHGQQVAYFLRQKLSLEYLLILLAWWL